MRKTNKLLLISLFGALAISLVSCGKEPRQYVEDGLDYNKGDVVDYAHNGSVQLLLDYKNHDFFQDGIGEVTVNTYIDGDTTHFRNIYGDTETNLKARYYGIDTPESTGAVQPFGKQASNFTHARLENAAANGTIVISSPFSTADDGSAGKYDKPETDSTGGRYLSLIWINETVKHAPVETLVPLNLWIVQEGLAWAKNTSEVPSYADVFSKAQEQANRHMVKIWSDDPDPYFNYGEYEYVSLLDIKRETEKYFEDITYVNKYAGANVRFNGVVAGFSNHNLYVQQYFPNDDTNPEAGGEWAGINVFTGMHTISSDYTTIGTYLEVVGNASYSETFGFQISGTEGRWPASLNGGDTDCKVILTASENDGEYALNTFEYTSAELNQNLKDKKYENLFCRTKITNELLVERAYLNNDGDEMTLYFKDCDFNAYIPFSYSGNPDDAGDKWMLEDKFIGKTFIVSGVLAYHQTSSGRITYQLVICNNDDLICTTPKPGTVSAEPYTVAEMHDHTVNNDVLPQVTYYTLGLVSEVYANTQTTVQPTATEITVAQALDIISNYTDGQTSSQEYALRGKITKINTAYNATTKKISFTLYGAGKYISVYNAEMGTGVDGGAITVGGEVLIQGKLKKYVSNNDAVTPEVVNGKVLSHFAATTISFKMSESGKDIYIDSAVVPSSVYAGMKEEEQSAAIANYLSKVVAGSTVSLKGIPTMKNNEVHLTGVTLQAVYLHGQYIENPLTPAEAYELAGELAEGKYSDDIYYIKGIVEDITSPYDESTRRISFTISVSGESQSFLINGARMANGLDYNNIVIGAQVVVSARLENNATLGYTTRQNGCQVVIISL